MAIPEFTVFNEISDDTVCTLFESEYVLIYRIDVVYHA